MGDRSAGSPMGARPGDGSVLGGRIGERGGGVCRDALPCNCAKRLCDDWVRSNGLSGSTSCSDLLMTWARPRFSEKHKSERAVTAACDKVLMESQFGVYQFGPWV